MGAGRGLGLGHDQPQPGVLVEDHGVADVDGDLAGLGREPALGGDPLGEGVEVEGGEGGGDAGHGPTSVIGWGAVVRAASKRESGSASSARRNQKKPRGPEGEQVGQLADAGEPGAAEHLLGPAALEGRQVELDGLGRAGHVVHAEHDVVLVGAQHREDLAVGGVQRLVGAEAEHRVLLAQGHEALDPAQQAAGGAQLGLHVHGLEAVDGVHQRRGVEGGEVGPAEAAVAVAGPLHRRADAVAVAQVDVVAHGDLVAVVEDRRARQGEEDGVHQLHVGPGPVEQRRQPAPDAHVDLHPRVLGVLRVHVVPLVVGDHLQGELVVVAEEQAPLAVLGDVRGAVEDLEHGRRVLPPQGHEHAGHHREVERHVALVAVAEVGDHVLGPLVGLGQQHPVRVLGVDRGPDPLQELVGAGQVLAVGALLLVEVGHGVEAEPVEAEVEPEAQDVEHRLLHVGVLVVEVGLVAEEAVPEVGPGLRVPGPVGRLGVGEDDPGVGVAVRRRRTRRTSPAWALSGSERDSWNHGCSLEVWFTTRSVMTRMPRSWAAARNALTSSRVP